eukprot:3135810-Prymnesium_polylepis.1
MTAPVLSPPPPPPLLESPSTCPDVIEGAATVGARGGSGGRANEEPPDVGWSGSGMGGGGGDGGHGRKLHGSIGSGAAGGGLGGMTARGKVRRERSAEGTLRLAETAAVSEVVSM